MSSVAITCGRHPQITASVRRGIGELTCRALLAGLGQRRATWPHTPTGTS